jgi:hypothetical protein
MKDIAKATTSNSVSEGVTGQREKDRGARGEIESTRGDRESDCGGKPSHGFIPIKANRFEAFAA